jgi:16S rRNA (cytidine1402-2'-O)-methyltransferase
MPGALHVIPVPLGDVAPADCLAPATLAAVRGLDLFFVEGAKAARAFLKAAGHPQPIAALEIREIASLATDMRSALAAVARGRDAGVLSEAGAPGVADPGANLVSAAHDLGIRVVPHVGPSAILLALMASGLNGQRVAFHGYLPVERPALAERIGALEAESARSGATQVFIETPYRNDRLLGALLERCAPSTRLAVAADLTLPSERVTVRTIAEWRRAPIEIGKRPAVFLLEARAKR